MIDYNFILDKNYLAYFILDNDMYQESTDITNIKSSLKDNIGYKKILKTEMLNESVYLNDKGIKELINGFINSNDFKLIYPKYNKESKERIAIKILTGYINDNSLEYQKDLLWDKHRDAYRRLLKIGFYNPSDYLKDQDVLDAINELINTDVFNKLYNETKEYFNYLENVWNSNRDYINNYLKEILRMEFNKIIDVYVSHPNAYAGYSFNGNIAWGHYLGINNDSYNLTYLVHETIHCLFPFGDQETEKESNVKHAIIELISDYELQSRLTNKCTINDGLPYLDNYRKKIYPYWLKYLGLNKNEIELRLQKDNMDNNDIVDKDLNEMNIIEFIQYCQEMEY